MAARVRSQKQAQAQRAESLRSEGMTWAEVAAIFRREYGVNARVALRLAHGWSQNDVADQWNERWPDDIKTFKNISYWEKWPASTGYTPSLEVLTKLADIYSCHVMDLLSDAADHRHEDAVFRARSDMAGLPAMVTMADDQSNRRDALSALVNRLEQADVQELARETATWATQLDSALDRRSLLLKLGFALTLAAATPADPDGNAAAAAPPPIRGGVIDLSGVWRSEYSYYSSGRGKDFAGVHYVVLHQQGASVAVESLAHTTGSEMGMSLMVDGMTATGSWEERTSPTGYYKGAIYRGALQFLVAPSGGRLTGRWLGFGKQFQINNGDWDLKLESRSLDRRTLKKYELKA
jgi:hypothetical protein